MHASLMTLSLIALIGGLSLATEMESTRALAQLQNAALGGQDVRELAPGAPIERELAGGQVHAYRITLASGQFLHMIVDQRGIDVVVKLFGPDGQRLAEVDSPNGAQGPEPVLVVAGTSGDYRLEVQPLEKAAAAGRYQVKIEVLRTATPQDSYRITAAKALVEGDDLYAQRTVDSRRRAIKKYEEALELSRAAADVEAQAESLSAIGGVYDSLGEYQKAMDYYYQALPLRRSLGDHRGVAAALHSIGKAYDSLGEKQKALDFFNQSLPPRRAAGDRRGESFTLNNIGAAYHDLGENQKAMDNHNQALLIARAINDRGEEGRSLNDIGALYGGLGEPQKALDYYKQALPLRRAVNYQAGEAATLNNIGMVYNSLGEYQRALDHFHQALPLRRAVGDPRREAFTLHSIGDAYQGLGEPQKALDYYGQALLLRHAMGARYEEAITLNSIGSVHFKLGESQKALDYFNQALQLSQALRGRTLEARILFNIARVGRGLNNLITASAQMAEALELVESVRTKVASQELRASFRAWVQEYYEFNIDLLMRLHQQRPTEGYDAAALQASERARARSLLETLTEARADIRQGVDPKLLERERALQQQLNVKERNRVGLLSGRHTAEQAAAANNELEALLTQYQEVQGQIRATSPRYAALTQPVPLNLKEIQQQALDADTLLLEYALGEERSFLWAVTTTSITSYELPKRAEVETAAQRAVELLRTSQQREHKVAAERAATELSRMLLGPVAAELEESKWKRLVIVSDGALQYMPFGALPLPVSGDRVKGRYRPLIGDLEVVSLPSVSVLAVLRRELAHRTPAAKTVAVFSDPVFQRDDPRIKLAQKITAAKADNGAHVSDAELSRSAAESGLMSFERLRFTRQEAEAIVTLARAEQSFNALDFAASRATVANAGLDQYRIVHFATHGLLNSRHPELSGVVLSLVDEQGRPQDGFLRAHEVYNLKLNADLVVLSACRTALGKEIKGEGLIGLTRGFMYAGAARVVASLWDVRDEATAELMKRYYQGMLKERLRPAEALRAAQVSMWKEPRWEAPYYWAGFVFQGEWK